MTNSPLHRNGSTRVLIGALVTCLTGLALAVFTWGVHKTEETHSTVVDHCTSDNPHPAINVSIEALNENVKAINKKLDRIEQLLLRRSNP